MNYYSEYRRRQLVYSRIVTIMSVVALSVGFAAVAGYSYWFASCIIKQRSLSVPQQMPSSRELPPTGSDELPTFDPESYLAEIRSGRNPREVEQEYQQKGSFRFKWKVDSWLTTGFATGHFVGTDTQVVATAPKGTKLGDRLESVGGFLCYRLRPEGGMAFCFE